MRIERLTSADYRALRRNAPARPAKYRNTKIVLPDGTRVDSKHEGKHLTLLRQRERRGEIGDLQTQVRFPLVVNGRKVCAYVADFVYRDGNGQLHVVDAKSAITRRNSTYRVKKKLFEAVTGLVIEEV